jgi:glycosyltransferase involved in cell wall biosynthesis
MVDSVITVSGYLRSTFLGRFYGLRTRTHVLHPGVDADDYVDDNEAKLEIRHRLGLGDNKVALLPLLPSTETGLPTILSSWPHVYQLTGAKLLLSGKARPGKGPMHSDVAEAASSLCRVSGESIQQAYMAADLLVVPSQRQDPMGSLILTALATGLPVAASLRGGIPELVDSTSGYLVRQYADGSAWSQALSSLLSDDRLLAELRVGALQRAGLFSWDRAADEMMQLYG